MKGISKAFARTPHLVTSKVGLSKIRASESSAESTDPEFDDYQRQFATIEDSTQKLLKDCAVFSAAVLSLLTSGQNFAAIFTTLFQPIAGEIDVIGKHPQAANTIRSVGQYQSVMDELRSVLSPELELIESRIAGPSKELQAVLKQIRKQITKREHKLVDFDRHNNSLAKLRDKKEKSLNDEKNLFKMEQDFETASNEYDAINTAMKTDLPRFLTLATQFIGPLFHSFYYMQLNIFYLMLEKLQGFAQEKYDITGTGDAIASNYEASRTDAAERLEGLDLTKRVVSTARMVQSRHGSAESSVTRSNTVTSGSGTLGKKIHPPGDAGNSQSSPSTAPPPYSPSVMAKKAPPPPPPLKPKPKAPEPPKQFVVALYDFAAQTDGDLDFRIGDRIELIERSASSDDWWTGKLNGKQGIFPGNYVQEA